MQIMLHVLPRRRTLVRSCTGVLLAGLLSPACPRAALALAQSTRATPAATTLSGSVVDASGKPIAAAQVVAESPNGAKPIETRTDGSGHFVMQSIQPGSYKVHATINGSESARSAVLVENDSRHDIRIVLNSAGGTSAAPNDGMSFVDTPNFVVAGVTDWTAVGGHGSDATLRTSEELNREALALRAKNAGTASLDASAAEAEERRLSAALSAAPDSYTANRDFGLFYLRQSRFAQAAMPLQAAARLGGGQPEDEYNLALVSVGKGDVQAADRHINRALAAKDESKYHLLAGEIQEKLGNPLAAVQHEEHATLLNPAEENYFAWGTELLAHRAIWQAAEVFAKGAKAYPGSVRMQTAWGAALFAGARYDEAAARICAASDLDPAAREPYLFAGKIAQASPTDIDCVVEKLERFLTLRPDDPEANYLSAMLLLKRRRDAVSTGRAQSLLLHAVALNPQCNDCYLQLGILSAARKDYPGAIAAYRTALQIDPRSGEAHFRLGVAYDRVGDAEQAKVEYKLHDTIDAENAATVEQQRRDVKQFTIETNTSEVHRGNQ